MARHPARRPQTDAAATLSVVLAFAFGVFFLAAMLILALAVPQPTDTQFEIFRIVVAVAASGAAAVVPGFLDLRMSAGARLTVQAGGALAVFVVVYFFSPARWLTGPAHNATTTGAQSPIISNNRGTVTIDYDRPPSPNSGKR